MTRRAIYFLGILCCLPFSLPTLATAQEELVEFQVCTDCPAMVVVPAGSFTMGSASNESEGYSDERPQHSVTIPEAFAVGKFEVTFAEWDACVAAGGCDGHRPDDSVWGRSQRPVINVSWDDAKGYISWLSGKTSHEYRLLSEAEWEYAARAGTTTKYSWGDDISNNRANCYRCGSQWDDDKTAPVGSFSANAFGLYDMHGNVWEWVEDCWNDFYSGAPSGGSAWSSGDCSKRVLRGGSWGNNPGYLRSANRDRYFTGSRDNSFGFRLARTLD